MKTLDLYLNEQLQNDEFRKEWENNLPEMDVIRAIVDARISQNLTQKELAERTGINQADISKFENGTRNPWIACCSSGHNLTINSFYDIFQIK